ncbi:MAG TPA: ABC transporter permease [Nitrososphaerales archaeon]|nr:ABC transporter permease [Nitrososphaerales archaeon]
MTEPAQPSRLGRLLSRSSLSSAWEVLKREREFTAGLAIVLFLVLVAVFAGQIAPYGPLTLSVGTPLNPPTPAHPFGTDNFGRDVLSRVIFSTMPDLTITVVAVALSMITGVPIGILSGYRGKRSDMVIMALVDIMLAFPLIVFAMALIVTLGLGATACTVAVGIGGLPLFARIARGETLVVRQSQYVEAAYAAGAKERRIMIKHVLPNIQAGIIVFATLDIGNALLLVAGLSFIGLGIGPPTAEWGLMVFQGTQYILRGDWWMTVFPGIAIILAVLGFNLMGDGLRDILDPHHQSQ